MMGGEDSEEPSRVVVTKKRGGVEKMTAAM